jgi:lactoylglutathione lyase
MKFGYTILYVESVTASLAFYEAAFGFKTRFLHDSNMYGELETGETVLAFASFEMGEMNFDGEYLKPALKDKPFGIEIAFVTPDIDAAYAHAVKAGCLALKPPVEKPWGQTVAYVRTPDGTLIELCTPVVEG